MEPKYNVFEAEKLREMKQKHPDWIWNRADTHVILGAPGSMEAYKVPVEPGNSFSPGPGTYGVSTWVFVNGGLHTPEQMPLDSIVWRFEEGFYPVLHSDWKAGPLRVHSELFCPDGDDQLGDYQACYQVTLVNESDMPVEAKLYLVLRSFGAAGGPVRSLERKDASVLVNSFGALYAENASFQFGAISYEQTGKDISEVLIAGNLPSSGSVQDSSTWASGALAYDVHLPAGVQAQYAFVCQMQVSRYSVQYLHGPALPLDFSARKTAFLERWRERLGIRLSLPDVRFTEAFQCQLTHLTMFTVDKAVRITPISYPIWWLRDGAYVVNALNKGGQHAFCADALRNVAAQDIFGGFGAEGDGPSASIWILSEHYLITRDLDFLRDVFPHIVRKAQLLMSMRRTDKPIRKFTEFVIPKCMLAPDTDLVCLPAKDGLINGRMDHHFPVYWVNGFAHMAMQRTAFCARTLGIDDAPYLKEAAEIKEAMLRIAPERFGENERDVNSAYWPTGWADAADTLIREKYDAYWHNVKMKDSVFHPVTDWTYFEAGHAHNYMLKGDRERAWQSIEWFFANQTAPGLYTYPEGVDGNTALLWPRTRGWDDIRSVTPHGWTAAELFLLLRDCLVHEEGDTLVIGQGVPVHWQHHAFSVENLPTYFGVVSFTYAPKSGELSVRLARKEACTVRSALPFSAQIVLE